MKMKPFIFHTEMHLKAHILIFGHYLNSCTKGRAHKSYKKEVAEMKGDKLIKITILRNICTTVKKSTSQSTQEKCISSDGLCNLHDLAYGVANFICKITTYPDFLIHERKSQETLEELFKFVSEKSHHSRSFCDK